MPYTEHELREVMSDTVLRDKMFLFLQNIFRLCPEDAFHELLDRCARECANDEAVYRRLEKELPSIQPFLGVVTYGLPALRKQKKVITQQTLRLLDGWRNGHATINGYVEIGSIGRYISVLRRHEKVEGDVVVVNDAPPERGQIAALGRFVPINDYGEISPQAVPDQSVDVVTCYIGLHHAADRLEPFALSIARMLRPGGAFILRDHDAGTPEMFKFCSAIHTVYNVGTGVPWERNVEEIRRFQGIDGWSQLLTGLGFVDAGERLLQDHDPSDNTLLRFTRS